MVTISNIKTWYNTYLKSYADKLADVIYCGDKSKYKNTSYNPLNVGTIGTNYGVGTNVNYYSAISRMVASGGGLGSAAYGISPTLVCPNDNLGGNLSKYTSADTVNGNVSLNGYKIGLLSADEIVFAGGGRAGNLNYYLYENASGSYWWSLSPSNFHSSGNAYIVDVAKNGSVNAD